MNYENIEVLYVEDNPYDIELTQIIFKKQNFLDKVHTVEDAEKALEFIFSTGDYQDKNKKYLPKLIILDLKLPKITGMEVLRQIKSDENKKVIPIVMLTSSSEEVDLIESYRYGVNSYIVKPNDYKQLQEVISEIGLYWLNWNKALQ